MVNVGIFYDHLEYFTDIWYNLWPFGIVCGHLLCFSQFGMFGPRKIWQPCVFCNVLNLNRVFVAPGTDVMILKMFSPKNLAKILAFFARTAATYFFAKI
jgi:hypothetical protein